MCVCAVHVCDSRNSWTKEWDSKLSEGVEKFGDDNWIMGARESSQFSCA